MPRRNNPVTKLQRQPPKQNCSHKRAFATREVAERTADELRKHHDNDTTNRVYLCADCGKWHMTSSQTSHM